MPARTAVHAPYAHISVPLEGGGWLNVVALQRGLATPVWPIAVQFATMAAISAAGIILVLGRLTRPLKELAKAASRLGRGETSAKLDEKGPVEVVETIRAFNEMQERLTTFVHDRAKMLAALGHDLRTPITILRLRAEFIEDDDVREQILRTLDEMAQMAEATLSFAREEAAQEPARLVDMGALTSSVCEDLADTGLDVTCADTGDFAVRCRPVAMKRALRNVVENAVTYGQRANVWAECKHGEARIVVEDEGPGIPVGEMEKVFKPFVRLEQSRNKDTGGVGLGLAIARSVIRSHGGDILLQNRRGRRTAGYYNLLQVAGAGNAALCQRTRPRNPAQRRRLGSIQRRRCEFRQRLGALREYGQPRVIAPFHDTGENALGEAPTHCRANIRLQRPRSK